MAIMGIIVDVCTYLTQSEVHDWNDPASWNHLIKKDADPVINCEHQTRWFN